MITAADIARSEAWNKAKAAIDKAALSGNAEEIMIAAMSALPGGCWQDEQRDERASFIRYAATKMKVV